MQNFLTNKKFLILGGSGFVGKSITEILLSYGARVVVLTRNSNKIKPLKVSGYPGQLEIISGNIFEDGLLELLIKDKFAVINLCGVLYEKNKDEFNIIHNFLPDMISKLCKRHNIKKFIHISALGVSKDSSSKYSLTKALGEESIKKNFKPSIILRPSIIYGKGDNFFGLFSKLSNVSSSLLAFFNSSEYFRSTSLDLFAALIIESEFFLLVLRLFNTLFFKVPKRNSDKILLTFWKSSIIAICRIPGKISNWDLRICFEISCDISGEFPKSSSPVNTRVGQLTGNGDCNSSSTPSTKTWYAFG